MNISSNDIIKNMSGKTDIKSILSKEVLEVKTKTQATAGVNAKDISLATLLDSLFKDLNSKLKTKDMILKILQDQAPIKDIKKTSSDIKSIINDLKSDKTLLKSTNILEKLVLDIKNLDAKSLQNQIKQSGLFLESKLLNLNTKQNLLPQTMKETLETLKNIIQNEDIKIDVSKIDKILNTKVANKEFINDIKQLVADSKISKNQKSIDLVAKLENLVQKTQIIESKITNNAPIKASDIQANIEKISSILTKAAELEPQVKGILTQINHDIAQIQNIPKQINVEFLKLNISEKLQRAVNLIKNDLVIKEPKADLHVKIAKHVQLIYEDLNVKIANKQIVPNQQLQALPNPKVEIFDDIKATLLQLKENMAKISSPSQHDTLQKIDKVITNINYYQLISYSSGSNLLYLPLLWDGLEEGEISIKKLKQKRFFCEINLKLRDYGKIDLMIMLFDDININISIFTKSDEFLQRVKANLQTLKQGINSVGLIPSNIFLYDSLKDDKIKRDTKSYIQGEQIGEGVNIHV